MFPLLVAMCLHNCLSEMPVKLLNFLSEVLVVSIQVIVEYVRTCKLEHHCLNF
jgi:hypothetical protein